MKKQKPLSDQNGEVRDLTEADFALMRPISAFPELVEILTVFQKLPKVEQMKTVVTSLD